MNGLDMTKFDDSPFNFSYDYDYMDENGLDRYERFILMFVNENSPCRIDDVFLAGTVFAIWNRVANSRSSEFDFLNDIQLPHTGWHTFLYRTRLSSLAEKGYVQIYGDAMIAPESTKVFAVLRSEYRGEEE
jgi:hypothetical protein